MQLRSLAACLLAAALATGAAEAQTVPYFLHIGGDAPRPIHVDPASGDLVEMNSNNILNVLSGGVPLLCGSSSPAPTALCDGSNHLLVDMGAPLPAGSNLIGSVATAGAANFAPASETITTTPVLIAAARSGRSSVTVESNSTTPVYLGGPGVTASTGFLLPGVAGASLSINFAGALYGVTSTGSAATFSYELY